MKCKRLTKMMYFKRDSYLLVLFYLLMNIFEDAWSYGIGGCPRIPYMENFNVTRFTGQWYEIERSFYLMQVVSSCVMIDLKTRRRGQLEVSVTARSQWTESITVNEGLALQTKRDPSVLHYKVTKYPKIISKYLPGSGFYQILHTDYDNYAVLWSCTNYAVFHTDLIWIWGREREINAKTRSIIYNLLYDYNLDSERLILPRNSNCTDLIW